MTQGRSATAESGADTGQAPDTRPVSPHLLEAVGLELHGGFRG